MLHKNVPQGDNHPIHNWLVANDAAREALAVEASDIGKVALQTDNNKMYALIVPSPKVWLTLGGGGEAAPFTLAPATADTLGGVKVGANLTVDAEGVLAGSAPYTLPTATAAVKGGVKIGSGVSVAGDGTISVAASSGGFDPGLAMNPATTTGLTFGYTAGKTRRSSYDNWTDIAAGTVALTGGAGTVVNHIFVNLSNGAVTAAVIGASPFWFGATEFPRGCAPIGIVNVVNSVVDQASFKDMRGLGQPAGMVTSTRTYAGGPHTEKVHNIPPGMGGIFLDEDTNTAYFYYHNPLTSTVQKLTFVA